MIYRARVHHTRHAPRRHAFVYGLYLFGLDIDELEDCNRFFPLLGRRRPGVFSVWDDDCLRQRRGPLRERLEAMLPEGPAHARGDAYRSRATSAMSSIP